MKTTTTELLQELNTMQSDHIKVLNERIEILIQTIKAQEKTLKVYLDNLNSKDV